VDDQQYEICNEEIAQDSANRHIFRFISSNSHFSLYPDIFANSNSSPFCINVVPGNREANINEFHVSFY